MKIISISGLDGSGKSTQIKLLQNYLESQGRRVFYFHAIKFGIANKISSHHCCDYEKQNENQEKSVTQSGKLGIILRKIFLRIDFWRFKKLFKKLEKEHFDFILSDRFFYDSLINIGYLENCDIENWKFIATALAGSRCGGKNWELGIENLSIYLQTDPKIIMERERKPDQGIEYLEKKKELYDKYAPIWNLKIIDGNKSQEEVFEEIKKEVSF